jgi:hypothetical protein
MIYLLAWALFSGIAIVGTHWLVERAFPRGDSWLNSRQLREQITQLQTELKETKELAAVENARIRCEIKAVARTLRQTVQSGHVAVLPRPLIIDLACDLEKSVDG